MCYLLTVIDLSTGELLWDEGIESRRQAIETKWAIDRNPYLLNWPHDPPWDYEISLKERVDGEWMEVEDEVYG